MNKQTLPSNQKNIFSILERIIVIFALCLFAGVVLDRDRFGIISEDVGAASPLTKAFFYSAYSFSILLAVSLYKRVLKFAFKDIFLWVYLATTFFSLIWSENFALTLVRSTTLLAVTMLGTYLATRYRLSELFQLLCIALALIAVFSLIFTILDPADAIASDITRLGNMRWQGILGHPTVFGRAMALSTQMWLLYLLSKQRYRLVGIGCVILSAMLTVLSGSVNAYIILFVVSGLTTILVTSRGRYRNLFLIAWLVIIAIAIIAMMSNYNLVVASFNRDATLTGRIPLWIAIFHTITQSPWLGYGYGAFWTGTGPSAAIRLLVGWQAPIAHNALLDIWLQVGLLGLLPFLLSLFRNLFKALAELKSKNMLESILPITLLANLIFCNIAESGIESGTIFWALYVFLSTYLSMRTVARPKLQQKTLQMKIT